jgi:hypothetical protein
MPVRRTAALSVLVCLALAPAALGALPKLTPNSIVIGKSIGGVHVGTTIATAKRAWGSGACAPAAGLTICNYAANRFFSTGKGAFSALKGKVTAITIFTGVNARTSAYTYTSPLKAFETAKGIHLGSTAAAVKRAYPNARSETLGREESNLTLNLGSPHPTVFDISKGRVYAIAIE